MRIKSFSEARGIFESEEFSLEPHIYCFGGGGDSDGGGDEPGDAMSPGQETAAHASTGADFGSGSSNDPDRGDDRAAQVSPNTGQVNTVNFNIDRSQPSVTTADGSRVYGDTVTLSQGLEEGAFGDDADFTDYGALQAGPSGSTIDTTFNPGNIGVGSGASLGATSNQNFVSSGGGGRSGPSAAEIAAQKAAEEAAKRERALEIASTPTFASPFDYESDAYGVVGGGIAARGPADIQGTRTDTPDALNIAAARDDFRSRGLDITGNIDPITGQPVPGSGTGTRDISTTINPIDDLDPFGDGFLSPEDKAEIAATEAATTARINALRGSSPVEQITSQATDPAAAMENEVAKGLGSLSAVSEPGAPVGLSGMPGYTGPTDSQQRIANVAAMNNLSAQADFERPFSPISNIEIGGVTVPSIIGAGINAAGEIVNTLDMYGGGNLPAYMENVIDRPAGTPVFSQGPKMSYAPSALELSPLEQAMVAGSEGAPLGPYSAGEDTQEVIGAIGPNNLGFLPGEPDLIYVGDKARFDEDFGDDNTLGIGYVYGGDDQDFGDPNRGLGDPSGTDDGTTTTTGGDDGGDDNGGDQDDKKPPVQCPEGFIYDEKAKACVPVGYVGQDIVGGGQYTPRGPINVAYTGLPSLAPANLKPTFQAKGKYSALFPTG